MLLFHFVGAASHAMAASAALGMARVVCSPPDERASVFSSCLDSPSGKIASHYRSQLLRHELL